MSEDITTRLFRWIESYKIPRPQISEWLGVDERTLSAYRSRGLPKKLTALAERIMAEKTPGAGPIGDEDNRLSITFSDEDFDLITRAALIVETPLKEFVEKATITAARRTLADTPPMLHAVAEESPPYAANTLGKTS